MQGTAILLAQLVIICVLGIGAVQSHAAERDDPQGDQRTHQQVDEQLQTLSALVEQLRVIAANTMPDEAVESAQAQRDILAQLLAEQDLRAQQEMAKYTRLIYIVSAVGLASSILGVVLLARNLALTNLIIDQERAWLVIKTGNARLADASFVQYGHIALILKLKNCGNSPAKNINIGGGYYVAEEFDANRRLDFIHDTNKGMVIGGNGEEVSLPIYIDEEDIDRARPGDNQQMIFFKIHVAYETTTGKGTKNLSGWYALKIVKDDRNAHLLNVEEKMELAITAIAGTFEFT